LEQELAGSEIAQGLMRAHGVADVSPLPKLGIEFFYFQGAGRDLIELSFSLCISRSKRDSPSNFSASCEAVPFLKRLMR
jgi:hypothetical protein